MSPKRYQDIIQMGNTAKIHVETIAHPLLGEVVPKERYGRQYIIYKHHVPSSISVESWLQQYQKLSLARKDSLFLPQTYTFNNSEARFAYCCGESISVDLSYQSCMYLLDMEIQNRRSQQKYYTEPDLWFMLYHMLDGVKEMEIRDIMVGDIRPKNILLNANGTIKMINRMSWPGEESGLTKVLNQTGDKCYLAPEELHVLKNMYSTFEDKTPPRPQKTQAFSVGMTALQLALLEPSQNLYDYKALTFNVPKLEKSLLACSQRYSKFFTEVLKMLTNLDASSRASCGECWATLNPYGSYIDNVISFTPNKHKSQESLFNYIKKMKSGKVV